MAIINPFKGLRPQNDLVAKVASRPYDVLNTSEARTEVAGNPLSFLHIIKSEIDLPLDTDPYDNSVYEKARENLDRFVAEGILVADPAPYLYVYRQIMGSHSQVGLVACSSIRDYFDDVIKKHEYTRPVKEQDRIRNMRTLRAHPGPVFLTYPDVEDIDAIIDDVTNSAPTNDFVASDGVAHTLWVVKDPARINALKDLFATKVPATYIADGHHRAASSAKVGKELMDENPAHTGEEEYNFFLSVLFPAGQLKIIDYNRLVLNLNGRTKEEFLAEIQQKFDVEKMGPEPYHPVRRHEYGMYLDGNWYKLTAHPNTYDQADAVGVLDISILSNHLIDPILGIADQRTDERIDFVGGIRGLGELQKRVDSGEMAVAFSLYPVSIEQLIAIADSGQVMPPKSTWFEPKLRSGLVIHQF